MPDDAQKVKEYVRERYGQRARQGEACCDPATLPNVGSYTSKEMDAVPVEALAVSAGCGNPTALAGLKPGEMVLDLGSGGGIDCFLAARQVGNSGKVYGVDMTPDMIDLARRNAQKLGLSNVEFLQGEIEEIPLDDSAVDVVISNCVVCLSPQKDAVFSETFRVLRPGGRLHVSDMVSRHELSEELRRDAEAWASCVAGADSLEVYLGRLRSAGFVDVEVTEEQAPSSDQAKELGLFSARVVAYKPR